MSDKIQYYGIDEDARDFLGGSGGGGGGPFLMEDAEDARRIADTSFDPSGYTWDLAVDNGVAGGANADGTSGIDVNPTADGGKTPDIANMHNKVFLVTIGAQQPAEELITIVGTTQIHFASYSGANVEYTFTPTANTEYPLEDGDSWVRVGTHFEPKKVAVLGTDGKVTPEQLPPITSDFLMEDASDASRIAEEPFWVQETSSSYLDGGGHSKGTVEYYVNFLDGHGNTFSASDLNGKTATVHLVNGETVYEYVDVVLEATETTFIWLKWAGMRLDNGFTMTIFLGKAKALIEGDAWVHNGTEFKPEQVALKSDLSTFRMEDASDASRHPEGSLDPAGYSFFYTYDSLVPTKIKRLNPIDSLYSLEEDKDGKTVPITELNGKLVDIFFDDVLHLRTTLTVTQSGVSPVYTWSGLVYPLPIAEGAVLKMVPVNTSYAPLTQGDAWVYDGTSFKPTQIPLKGESLMQDALDAELNDVIDFPFGTGWSFDWVGSNALNTGDAKDFTSTDMLVSATDQLGKAMDESLDGVVSYVKLGSAPAIQKILTVTFFNTNYKVSWDTIDTDIQSMSLGDDVLIATSVDVKELLADGDAWVYNGAESKFKPTQVGGGATDTFTTNDGKTVTVVNGLITTIV